MSTPGLDGLKIGVIVENKFIPEEIEAYRIGFSLLGAKVEFISRIWYGDSRPERAVFFSDVDPLDNAPWESPQGLEVMRDISTVDPENGEFAAFIMSANYTSIRLRYFPEETSGDPKELIKTPPVVEFFARAMKTPAVVKGALCHGLWVLTPNPELLRGRRVTCHTVVMADIVNCGAEIVFGKNSEGRDRVAEVVKDSDLVTGFSKHEAVPFVRAIGEQIVALRNDADIATRS